MHLCRVTGTVVATVKQPRMAGQRLLLVRRMRPDGTLRGAEEVALDPGLDAGPGDAVLTAKEGAVAAQLFDGPGSREPMPANVVIVAVVDAWSAA
ncbi:MAG: EutN/CcmL family microcompartment protein [Rubricoccaceae bacterium]